MELIYAAYQRCRCGVGMAHPKEADPRRGAWTCSAVLKGEAAIEGEGEVDQHTPPMPFAMYSLEEELTTRESVAR